MQYDLKFKIGNLMAIPLDAAGKIVAQREPDTALLFLYLVQCGGSTDRGTACGATGLSEARFERALSSLVRLGVIADSGTSGAGGASGTSGAFGTSGASGTSGAFGSAEKTPAKRDEPGKTGPAGKVKPAQLTVEQADYTPEEIARGLSGDPAFAWLYKETEARFGRVLKQYEASMLYSMYDYLKLPPEVIAMLVNHMAGECEARIREGRDTRPLSFRELSREACRWSDLGIDSPERADAHIQELTARKSAYGTVLRILNIRDRMPTATEDRYISAWLSQGVGFDLVERAYDITVTNKGKLVWPYMNTILESWRQKGYRCAADVEKNEPRGRKASAGNGGAYDGQESAYLERVRRSMRENDGKS